MTGSPAITAQDTGDTDHEILVEDWNSTNHDPLFRRELQILLQPDAFLNDEIVNAHGVLGERTEGHGRIFFNSHWYKSLSSKVGDRRQRLLVSSWKVARQVIAAPVI